MGKIHLVLLSAALAVATPSRALAQNGAIQGFGGFTLRGVSPSTTFGGSLSVPIVDNVHIVGEGGRIADLTTAPLAELIGLTPVDLRVSAYYGEAGVRILASSDRAVRPYGEATAGFARLHTNVGGIPYSPIVNSALTFLDSTRPMYGLGAGVLVSAGPLVVDLGYRYQRLGTSSAIQSALTGGRLDVQQVRLGIGVRF